MQIGITLVGNLAVAFSGATLGARLTASLVGHLSEVGQRLDLQGWTIEVVDLDGRRIDKLLDGRSG